MDQSEFIWMNGEIVPWDDAKVHVLSHGLHYGTGVFEGMRAYETPNGTAIFRHQDHIRRLFSSAKLYYIELPFTRDEILQASHDLLIANGLRECYIRPIAFYGYGTMGIDPRQASTDVAIAAWPWGAYLGADSSEQGIRAKVVSWRRPASDAAIGLAKASGQYLNSILAKIESTKAGYDEAIVLDSRGFVCEGSGENLFLVRNGTILTPPLASSVLDGITRASIIRIAADCGYELIERDLARAELYLADELFLTGTAAEVVPVREIDDHAVGDGVRGPVTAELQRVFHDALRGRDQRYAHWLDYVQVPAPAR